jgi:hypothetical protein
MAREPRSLTTAVMVLVWLVGDEGTSEMTTESKAGKKRRVRWSLCSSGPASGGSGVCYRRRLIKRREDDGWPMRERRRVVAPWFRNSGDGGCLVVVGGLPTQ